MSKKKGKRKKKGVKINPEDYEGFTYGPLKFERFGRVVKMSSNWKPGEFEKHIERVRKQPPSFKKEIDEKTAKLISMISEYDPLELLASVAMRNCFTDPEKYAESSDERREAFIEYALSISLSKKRDKEVKHATKEKIEEFNKLIEEVFNGVHWYFGSETAEGKYNEAEERLRFASLLRFLYIRGDSYQEHHLDMIKGVFGRHDAFFRENYGFDSEKAIAGIQSIEGQLLDNIHGQKNFWSTATELHELFKEFVDREGTDSFESPDDLKEKYHSLPEVQEKMKELDKFQDVANENPFEVKPTSRVTAEMLDLMSASFGENEAFADFEKSPAWPTNDTIIFEKPLVKEEGKYYCFDPILMFRRMGDILESWIREKDRDYYQTQFLDGRAEYLEEKALEYISKILPGAEVFGKLFYEISEDRATKRVETDGMVLFDENIFIIEAKAGSLSMSARRGSIDRTKRDIKELIDHAYEQATRTKRYIMDSDCPRFENEDGSEALIIRDKTKYRNIYLCNITMEHLAHLSTQLNSLKSLKLIQEREWPWSVFINDLRVISEVIESPSEFLHYLKRRIRANDYPQFRSADELDFLMFYFKEGLYFEDGILKDTDRFTPHAYTEELDRYYDYIGGRVSSGKKPRLGISNAYREFIDEIEKTGKHGFTRLTTFLLSLDWKEQQRTLKTIDELSSSALEEKRDRDFSLQIDDVKTGITFSISPGRKDRTLTKLGDYCRLKMYETKFGEWLLMAIDVQSGGKRAIDFKTFDKEWKHDPAMENELAKLAAARASRSLAARRNKVGRNDPCPCGSGLKFKKCCGKHI